VLAVRRIPYDTGGRAVEVNDMTLSGDRYKLSYEIPAE
jgi:GntR family transcriptional regulator